MQALKTSGRPWTLNNGEGAFYGPKLEYVLRDAISHSSNSDRNKSAKSSDRGVVVTFGIPSSPLGSLRMYKMLRCKSSAERTTAPSFFPTKSRTSSL